jgi:predicted TIM-barrel fold metal-dependent hydrolase
VIIDAHFHIFPPFGTESGGEDPKLNMRIFLHHMRPHASRFRRKSDGALVEKPFFQFATDDLKDVPDVNFRMTHFGQAEITVDGVDYLYQAVPPHLGKDNEAPPERMVLEMDEVGVDMGVLQHDHIYGSLNEYYGEAMREYPNRFIGLAQVREWEADQPAQHERLERAVLEHGNKGLYFSVEPFALSSFADHLDDAKFEPLWRKVQELKIPVWWFIGSRRIDRFAGYMGHVAELNRWAERHPEIPAVLTHGFDCFGIRRGTPQQHEIPDELMALLKRPNMYFEMLFLAFWPEYPFLGAQQLIRRLCDELGPEKMMWGTDHFVLQNWCTYKQALNYVRNSELLSEEEKSLILGGNAAKMFNVTS